MLSGLSTRLRRGGGAPVAGAPARGVDAAVAGGEEGPRGVPRHPRGQAPPTGRKWEAPPRTLGTPATEPGEGPMPPASSGVLARDLQPQPARRHGGRRRRPLWYDCGGEPRSSMPLASPDPSTPEPTQEGEVELMYTIRTAVSLGPGRPRGRDGGCEGAQGRHGGGLLLPPHRPPVERRRPIVLLQQRDYPGGQPQPKPGKKTLCICSISVPSQGDPWYPPRFWVERGGLLYLPTFDRCPPLRHTQRPFSRGPNTNGKKTWPSRYTKAFNLQPECPARMLHRSTRRPSQVESSGPQCSPPLTPRFPFDHGVPIMDRCPPLTYTLRPWP